MTTNRYAGLAQPDFLRAAQGSLVTGDAWPRDTSATQTAVLQAIADVAASIHASVTNFSEIESDPGQAIQLLTDWEAEYGLPDPCTPLSPTIAQRHGALLAKIIGVGGQSNAYFVAVAAALGYTVTITPYRPFRVGQSGIGTPLYGIGWIFALNVAGAAGHADLQCRLTAVAGARMVLIFS